MPCLNDLQEYVVLNVTTQMLKFAVREKSEDWLVNIKHYVVERYPMIHQPTFAVTVK